MILQKPAAIDFAAGFCIQSSGSDRGDGNITRRRVDVILGLDGRLHGDPDRIAQSFRIQADMNPRVQQCVKHMYISYLPDDIVAMVNNTVSEKDAVYTVQDAIDKFGQEKVNSIVNEAMVNDWQTVLSKLGYANSQYLIVRHSEKNNPHSHCILNMKELQRLNPEDETDAT